MIVLAAALVGLIIAAVAVALELHGNRAIRSRTKRRVLVTTKSGLWFSGVLFAHDRRSLVIREAQTDAEGGSTVVDGEVLILSDDVAYIQFP